MNPVVNVLDLELNGPDIIEIGLTFVRWSDLSITGSVSIPIWPLKHGPVTAEITELTGWTDAKLKKRGVPLDKACTRLREKYGAYGRILVVDSDDEIDHFAEFHFAPFGSSILNISTLFRIAFTGSAVRHLMKCSRDSA